MRDRHLKFHEDRDNLRHLAQKIVDRLGLTQESADDRSRKIRDVSAWFDDERTKLEGAQ